MTDMLDQIRQFMEKEGVCGKDAHDLPDSQKTFPDGAHFRIEIAGVERPSTMEAMIDEAHHRKIPVHRVIASVGGATYLEFRELEEMARLAAETGIEVIMTTGPRKAWDAGAREFATAEGSQQGFRLRGADHTAYHIADILRCIDAGHRGFLVYDEGVLFLLSRMRAEGLLPPETIFKFSVFGGYCSPAGAKVAASMGANSLNPASDVSLPILGAIRKTVDIPLDVYMIVVDSFGGMFRAYEAPEIARVAAPCYFKFEPGTSEADIYKPWVTESFHENLIREKVKLAAIVLEIMERHAPGLCTSQTGADDLVLPKV